MPGSGRRKTSRLLGTHPRAGCGGGGGRPAVAAHHHDGYQVVGVGAGVLLEVNPGGALHAALRPGAPDGRVARSGCGPGPQHREGSA